MKYLNNIKFFIFVIGMMMNVQIYAQGDVLDIVQKCEPNSLDLAITGGFSPYEVEWQAWVNGSWQTLAGWPKTSLNGNDTQEDLYGSFYHTQYKVIVHDELCGIAEKEIEIDPCKCVEIDLTYLGNVEECGAPSYQKNTGAITLSISGTTDYSVLWSNGMRGLSINKLVTGVYTVTITSGACQIIKDYTVCCCDVVTEEPPGPPIIVCPGGQNGISIISSEKNSPTNSTSFDGSIKLVTSGANVIIWYDSNGNEIGYNKNIFGLGVGTFCVQLLGTCGSSLSQCFTLVDCSVNIVTVEGQVTNTCSGYSVGIISAIASGGLGPYKYKWSNGENTAMIDHLSQGQYCVTVSDSNGCKASRCFQVGLNDLNETRNGCVFTYTCNGDFVNSINIGSFSSVRSGDCRFIDTYCNDGFYLGSVFAGTNFEIIGNCTVNERCNTTGSLFATHTGVVTTSTLGPEFQPNRNCWWCHTATYCSFPTLGGWINPNSISLLSFFESSYVPNGCGIGVCLNRIWCRGIMIHEYCDHGCSTSDFPCTIRDLLINYETETRSILNEDKQNEIVTKYNIISFDTLAMAEYIKEGNFANLNTENDIELSPLKYALGKSPINFKLYPNPSFDYFNIEIDAILLNTKSSFILELYDFTGQKLLKQNLRFSDASLNTVPISDIPVGSYKAIIIDETSGIQLFETILLKL